MTESEYETDARPFQFSLRTMFIVTALVALVCGGLFSPWDWFQNLTLFLLGVMVPMAVGVAAIYSRGYARTFWIGAAFPAATFLLSTAAQTPLSAFTTFSEVLGDSKDPQANRLANGLDAIGALATIVLVGLLALLVRWMVESPQRMRTRQLAQADKEIAGAPEARDGA